MELWDIYDENRIKTGQVLPRDQMRSPDAYHLVVGIAVYNEAGQVLITKRAPEKPTDPGKWESTAGAVIAGENSLEGACRELYEETGISAAPEDMVLVYQTRGAGHSGGALIDVYTVKRDIPLAQIRLQPGETCDAKWIEAACWYRGIQSGDVLFLGWDEKEKIAKAVMDVMNNKENE